MKPFSNFGGWAFGVGVRAQRLSLTRPALLLSYLRIWMWMSSCIDAHIHHVLQQKIVYSCPLDWSMEIKYPVIGLSIESNILPSL